MEVNRQVVGSPVQSGLSAGYVGLGAGGYYGVQFDNFYMEGKYRCIINVFGILAWLLSQYYRCCRKVVLMD